MGRPAAGWMRGWVFVPGDFMYRPIFLFLKKDFIYLFLERWEMREKERERDIDRLPLAQPQRGTWPRNPGMCPDLESNRRPIGLQAMPNTLSHTSQD